MREIELEKGEVRIAGALGFDRTEHGLTPRRLPDWTRPQVSSGKSFFRSRSVWATLRPDDSRQRAASRWMWVSTGNDGTPKDWAMTTLAVLCPTPASDSR